MLGRSIGLGFPFPLVRAQAVGCSVMCALPSWLPPRYEAESLALQTNIHIPETKAVTEVTLRAGRL